ncbi:MAG: SoxR reducing system RseC family protein [Thermoanaerobacteraceae bacterium]|nr:SoxR reducing system RseC family protein [Thermoanaerobacteraceae bacterium]
MLEKARVIKTYDKMARIMVIRGEMCGGCHACPVSKGEEFYLDVYNEAGAQEGDEVEVEMENNDFLGASMIIYGIPLLSFFLGVFAGYFAFPIFGLSKPNEIIAALSGFAFTIISYLLIRYFEPRFKESRRFKPVIKYVVK